MAPAPEPPTSPTASSTSRSSGLPRQRRSWTERTFSNPGAGSVRGSIFNLVASCVGMGVLLLPYCMKKVGPLCFLVLLIAGAASSAISLQICCAGMRVAGAHSYVDTLTALFSERVSMVLTSMLVFSCFGLCCGYFVFSSQIIHQLLGVAGVDCPRWAVVITIACFPVLPLSFFKNLSDFRYISLCSTLGLLYLTGLVFVRTPHYLKTSDALRSGWWWEIPDVSAMPKVLSLCMTAYVVHMVVFSTYNELVEPSASRIKKVIWRSVLGETMLYVAIAVCGYLSFGSLTSDNILLNYDVRSLASNIGRFVVAWQLLMALPLTVNPARIYTWPVVLFCRKRRECPTVEFQNAVRQHLQADTPEPLAGHPRVDALGGSFASDESSVTDIPSPAHEIITVAYVVSSACVGAAVGSASDLLGVVGGFACVTYAFLLPGEMARTMRNGAKDGSLNIDWDQSPAAFLNGPCGIFAINGLRLCSAIGYVAAGKCAYNLATGTN